MIVRYADPVQGAELANQFTKALLIKTPEVHTVAGKRIQISLVCPKTLPIQFPRLEGNGLEFSINFKAVFVTKPAWKA